MATGRGRGSPSPSSIPEATNFPVPSPNPRRRTPHPPPWPRPQRGSGFPEPEKSPQIWRSGSSPICRGRGRRRRKATTENKEPTEDEAWRKRSRRRSRPREATEEEAAVAWRRRRRWWPGGADCVYVERRESERREERERVLICLDWYRYYCRNQDIKNRHDGVVGVEIMDQIEKIGLGSTDMDAKVKAMIKLIDEDADSFARRAEMYYKKWPELMKLVKAFYRAYRALAERYDHTTGELRQADRTMAEAFPNQVPYVLFGNSPSGSSAHEREPHTPEMPHRYKHCLEKISKLESELSCAQEEIRCLNRVVLIESAKLKSAEENLDQNHTVKASDFLLNTREFTLQLGYFLQAMLIPMWHFRRCPGLLPN
ncbi:hypothetical protein HYC85_019288 [Camellia sinensis]|uniref:NAB domain-containing protein n=1 Tax=Camellia sinensis TaxID=4442 RepID=A0A7J7GQ98_CAMSI|nr:hypothetical protein HYC85_019288 [Camellia sinensis]